MAFPGPRPPAGSQCLLGIRHHSQSLSLYPQSFSFTPHNTPNLLGVDNAVYSPGLGSGPDLTGRVSISLPHSVAAAAAAAARQPNLGYSVAFRGQKWLADDGQSSGGHDPHSLTKASCAACVWRQGTGAGTGWILSSEAIPDECISVSLNIP